MIETPQIIHTATQRTAFIHVIVPWDEIGQVMGPGIQELMSTLAAQGIAPVGPWFTHHRRRPTDTFDLEISIPVDGVVAPAGRVRASEWPAMKVARTVYQGPYEGLAGSWGEFIDWIESQGHATGEDLWERYLVGPESSLDPAAWRTELNRPLVESASPT